MKPYSEYKPTGLAWLPEIPKHWDWIMLSQIATEQCNKNAERTERNVLSLSYGRIIQKKNLFAGLSPQDYGTYQIISPGNIVMRLTDLQNDHKSLRTGLAEMRGIITSAYTCLRTNHNPAFLHYLLHCYDIRKVFYGLGGGVRQSIGFKDIRGLRFPLPPADEQAQIVRYLDAMTAKINKLIRAKKRQIALLQEQKQAIINQAVTRGLDPDVELKDSGIDWLGPIPKHWKKDKIFRLFVNIGSGTTPHNGNAFFYQNGTIPWVNSGDLYAGGKFISNIAKKVSPSALLDYSVLKLYPVNTIVIAMYGGSIGNMGILQEEACCNQACCCLASTRKDFFLDFAFYLLSSYKNYWIEKSNGGGQPNISQEIIKQTWVGLPPRSEQAEIVIYLDKKVKDFDILR